MKLSTSFRGRLSRASMLGLFALSLIPTPGTFAATSDQPLDLGMAFLSPVHLAEFGFDNFGIDSGRNYSLKEFVEAANGPGSADDPGYDEIGIASIQTLDLMPIGGWEEAPGPDVKITMLLFEYIDDEHAEAGWAMIEDESDDPTMVDLPNSPELGDEAEVSEFREDADDSISGYDTHGIDVSFRIGHVTATMQLMGFEEDVDRDDVEAMAVLLEERLYSLIEDGEVDGVDAPGLSRMVPRHVADTLARGRSHYRVIDGEVLLQAYFPDDSAQFQETVDDYGIISDYATMTFIPLVGETRLTLTSGITELDQASDAEDWVADAFDELEDAEIHSTDDLPFDVDSAAAATIAYDNDGTEMFATRLVVQQGRYVIELVLHGFSEPSLELMTLLMEDALDCADEPCADTIEAPDELIEFQEEQIEIVEEM